MAVQCPCLTAGKEEDARGGGSTMRSTKRQRDVGKKHEEDLEGHEGI